MIDKERKLISTLLKLKSSARWKTLSYNQNTSQTRKISSKIYLIKKLALKIYKKS